MEWRNLTASYLFNIIFGAAIDIAARAALAQQARGDITQGYKASITIATANNHLVTFAGGAAAPSDGCRDGRGSKKQRNEEDLHDDWSEVFGITNCKYHLSVLITGDISENLEL